MNEHKKGVKAVKKPRNLVAKFSSATTSGSGAHKDKKHAMKRGEVKHKGKQYDYAEHLEKSLENQLEEMFHGGFGGQAKFTKAPKAKKTDLKKELARSKRLKADIIKTEIEKLKNLALSGSPEEKEFARNEIYRLRAAIRGEEVEEDLKGNKYSSTMNFATSDHNKRWSPKLSNKASHELWSILKDVEKNHDKLYNQGKFELNKKKKAGIDTSRSKQIRISGLDHKPYRRGTSEEVEEGLGKYLVTGAALIAAIWGIGNHEAEKVYARSPQLQKLEQFHTQALQKGDMAKARELEQRILNQKTRLELGKGEVKDKNDKPIDVVYDENMEEGLPVNVDALLQRGDRSHNPAPWWARAGDINYMSPTEVKKDLKLKVYFPDMFVSPQSRHHFKGDEGAVAKAAEDLGMEQDDNDQWYYPVYKLDDKTKTGITRAKYLFGEKMDKVKVEKKSDDEVSEGTDAEGGMARTQLLVAAKLAIKMASKMRDDTQLDSWVQSKIAVASDYLETVFDFLEHGQQDVDQVSEGTKEKPTVAQTDKDYANALDRAENPKGKRPVSARSLQKKREAALKNRFDRGY